MELKGKWDVVVVGGGPAGLVAAIASGRNGAKTLLVERYGFLGGNLTAALIAPLMTTHYKDEQVNKGILKEITDRLIAIEGSLGPLKCPYEGETTFGTGGYITHFDPEKLKYLAFQMIEEARVELLLHSFFTDAFVEDGTIKGIEVINKSGRQMILADVVIDASGDADVAAAGGAKTKKGEEVSGLMQPATLFFHMAGVDIEKVREYIVKNPKEFAWYTFPIVDRPVPQGLQKSHVAGSGFYGLVKEAMEKGELRLGRNRITFFSGLREGHWIGNATRIIKVDGTKVEDLTYAEIEGRKQVMSLVNFLKKYVPGFESSYLMVTGAQVGIRETRQIVGEYVLTREDIIEGREFEDAIAKGGYPIDIHQVDGPGGTWIELKEPYDIPYRALIPKEIEGLIVAGRCISATHEAMAAIRVMPICMCLGQAAGTAAALAVKAGVSPRQVDISLLKKTLKEQEVVL